MKLNEDYVVKKTRNKICVEPHAGINIKNHHVFFEINNTAFIFLKLLNEYNDYNNTMSQLHTLFDCEGSKIDKDFKELYEFFCSKNILVDDDIESKGKIIEFEDLVVPEHVSLEMTDLCQLECKHCFNSYNTRKSIGYHHMSIIDAQKVIDDLNKMNIQTLQLTGGECMLNPDFEDIIVYASRKVNRICVATNGFKPIKDDLLEKIKNKNVSFQISIDGSKSYHDNFRGKNGAYNNAISNIKKLKLYGFEVQVAYTLNKDNVQYLENEIISFDKIGVNAINIGNTSQLGNASKNSVHSLTYREFNKILADMNNKFSNKNIIISKEINCLENLKEEFPNLCGAGFKILHIKSNLDIVPCPSLPNIKIGNWKCGYDEFLNYKKIEKYYKLESPRKDNCKGCKLGFQCAGCIACKMSQEEEGNCVYGNSKV